MVSSKNDYKVENLIKNCIYLIATGKWLPGEKLPSIRQAEERWDANRITINKAYKKLEEGGYVTCRPKSGYYVSDHNVIRDKFRFQHELERLYNELKEKVVLETGLSPLGVFRYLAEKSYIESRENPECAFVECTYIEALGHAGEIENRLVIPVLPVSLSHLEGKAKRFPESIRVVFTTVFHLDEMRQILKGTELKLVPIAIEVAAEIQEEVKQLRGRALFLEREEDMGQSIAEDTRKLLSGTDIQVKIETSPQEYLQKNYDSFTEEDLLLLSPRLWGSIEPCWREKGNIRPVTFTISDNAWSGIAEALGLPLGL